MIILLCDKCGDKVAPEVLGQEALNGEIGRMFIALGGQTTQHWSRLKMLIETIESNHKLLTERKP